MTTIAHEGFSLPKLIAVTVMPPDDRQWTGGLA